MALGVRVVLVYFRSYVLIVVVGISGSIFYYAAQVRLRGIRTGPYGN